MHGNTECVNNFKTRRYENIRAEVEAFFDVHDECGECYPAHHLQLRLGELTASSGAGWL